MMSIYAQSILKRLSDTFHWLFNTYNYKRNELQRFCKFKVGDLIIWQATNYSTQPSKKETRTYEIVDLKVGKGRNVYQRILYSEYIMQDSLKGTFDSVSVTTGDEEFILDVKRILQKKLTNDIKGLNNAD